MKTFRCQDCWRFVWLAGTNADTQICDSCGGHLSPEPVGRITITPSGQSRPSSVAIIQNVTGVGGAGAGIVVNEGDAYIIDSALYGVPVATEVAPGARIHVKGLKHRPERKRRRSGKGR